MRRYRFIQVDVFTHSAFGGNQLAVLMHAENLSDIEMQLIAREMAFSETSFILQPKQPGRLRRVRIFTPQVELPIAGHPVIGTARALLYDLVIPSDRQSDIIFELGSEPVSLTVEGGEEEAIIWMTFGTPQLGGIRDDRARVAKALGLRIEDLHPDRLIQVASAGLPYLLVPLRSIEAIERCRSDARALSALFTMDDQASVLPFTTEAVTAGAAAHLRMFSPHVAGVAEDPATGSAAAPLAAYLLEHNIVTELEASHLIFEQGLEMGRPSQLHVEIDVKDQARRTVRVGGSALVVGEGNLFLPDQQLQS